jgi:hypothetical protein
MKNICLIIICLICSASIPGKSISDELVKFDAFKDNFHNVFGNYKDREAPFPVNKSDVSRQFLFPCLTFYNRIYRSQNLADYTIFAECLDKGRCDTCSKNDVAIHIFDSHAEVVSNVNQRKVYVNALAYKKFQEVFPDGEPVSEKIYVYKGKIKIPEIPSPDSSQIANPQAIHTMIQYWNPKESKLSYEGAIYWDINPWLNNYEINVYTVDKKGKLFLYPTGLKVKPCNKWYNFEMSVNMKTKKYIYIIFDNYLIPLWHMKLAYVSHPDWGNDKSISITAESLASWPGKNCNVFTWRTLFKDVEFGYIASDLIDRIFETVDDKPFLEIQYVPPYGNRIKQLKGQVFNVDTNKCRIAAYIFVDNSWRLKPVADNPLIKIEENGKWVCDITRLGNDHKATKISVFVLPTHFEIPRKVIGKDLPESLYQNAICKQEVFRVSGR